MTPRLLLPSVMLALQWSGFYHSSADFANEMETAAGRPAAT